MVSSLAKMVVRYFDVSSLEEIDIRGLSIGHVVEYQEHFANERLRAAKVRAYRTLEANPQVGVEFFLCPPIPFAGMESRPLLAHVADWLSGPGWIFVREVGV